MKDESFNGSGDMKKHPIIKYDSFKHLAPAGLDISQIDKFIMRLKFSDDGAKKAATSKWHTDPNDHNEYFYLVVDAPAAEDPTITRATPFQIQSIKEADGKHLMLELEAYKMAWDVLGNLDLNVFRDNDAGTSSDPAARTTKPNKNGLAKRGDLNPNFSIDVGINKKHEEKVIFDCKECWSSGSVDLTARFRTSCFTIQEASITAKANKIQAAIDIQAELEAKFVVDRNSKSKAFKIPDKEIQIAHFPLSPLTILVTAGVRFEAEYDTEIKIDLLTGSFDPNPMKKPQLGWRPYVKEAKISANIGAALVISIDASLDILGTGIASGVELLFPKFELGLPKTQQRITYEREKEKDPLDVQSEIGFSAQPKLGYQVKFVPLKGEGLFNDVLKSAGIGSIELEGLPW
ncbi:hypothetical protein H072_5650 [Dactylellina haptotyla CBS 200.50]|uniref:Uncharacterized protein n=1 Tax=Dactylellina haptotyla (strain CBS 200.50) TaxID=1284197 RepID=S8AC39_DACHA|nr:hypothetical protein H072_5650 [Dactylellina haptotyla CBS 200.50]